MSYDPNHPPDSGQQPQQPPYGQPQPLFGHPGQPQSPYEQQWGQQPLQNYAPTQYGVSAYSTQPVPGYMPPQQLRRSRRGLWIVLGIIGGLLVFGCGGCGILLTQRLFAVSTNDYNSKEAASAMIVKQYYNAVKKQDYPTAYSYLSTDLTTQNSQPYTLEMYWTSALDVDSVKGQVTNYSVGDIVRDDSDEWLGDIFRDDSDEWQVTVTVTRGSNPVYNVHLQLRQINGTWQITYYDKI